MAKKIINYYDRLECLRRNRSASRDRKSERSTSRGANKVEPVVVPYNDCEHIDFKQSDLKRIINSELLVSNRGQSPPRDDSPRQAELRLQRMVKNSSNFSFGNNAEIQTKLEGYASRRLELQRSQDFELPPDEGLYHLEIKKKVETRNKFEHDNFDFHQRKSKEIRRLQYFSGLSKDPVKSTNENPPTPAEYLQGIATIGFGEDHYYPCTFCPLQSARQGESGELVLKQDDQVLLAIPELHGSLLQCRIARPTKDELGSSLVLEHLESGTRYRISFGEATPSRLVPNQNCVQRDAQNQEVARARVRLFQTGEQGENLRYYLGAYLNSQNQLFRVLVKTAGAGRITVKGENQEEFEEYVEASEFVSVRNQAVKKLTLKKKGFPGEGSYDKLVYLIDEEIGLTEENLLVNERVEVLATNLTEYKGTISAISSHKDEIRVAASCSPLQSTLFELAKGTSSMFTFCIENRNLKPSLTIDEYWPEMTKITNFRHQKASQSERQAAQLVETTKKLDPQPNEIDMAKRKPKQTPVATPKNNPGTVKTDSLNYSVTGRRKEEDSKSIQTFNISNLKSKEVSSNKDKKKPELQKNKGVSKVAEKDSAKTEILSEKRTYEDGEVSYYRSSEKVANWTGEGEGGANRPTGVRGWEEVQARPGLEERRKAENKMYESLQMVSLERRGQPEDVQLGGQVVSDEIPEFRSQQQEQSYDEIYQNIPEDLNGRSQSGSSRTEEKKYNR